MDIDGLCNFSLFFGARLEWSSALSLGFSNIRLCSALTLLSTPCLHVLSVLKPTSHPAVNSWGPRRPPTFRLISSSKQTSLTFPPCPFLWSPSNTKLIFLAHSQPSMNPQITPTGFHPLQISSIFKRVSFCFFFWVNIFLKRFQKWSDQNTCYFLDNAQRIKTNFWAAVGSIVAQRRDTSLGGMSFDVFVGQQKIL